MFSPTQFGKYYLTQRIAVGGMAEIFKAKLFGASGFEKPMVVKQILPQYSRNDEFINMFIDEAKIAVHLTHGNIVPVYELGRIKGTYFIAMEYVHGKNLAEVLEMGRQNQVSLTPDLAVFLTIEICKGLDYAHRRTSEEGRPLGVVHRDVSPPNILVSIDGLVKITDFGIAQATHKLGSTESGVVKGTFGYMSPEQVRGLPVDHRTDIFSTGILMHEMLSGRRLFTGNSDMEAIERVKAAQISSPSSLNPEVPSALDPIVFKALAKDPADRYASASEFQLALSRYLFTGGAGATSSTLANYMAMLFADDDGDDDGNAEEEILYSSIEPEEILEDTVVSDSARSFAVSPEMEEATSVIRHPAPEMIQRGDERPSLGPSLRGPVVVGEAAAAPINATMAMPAMSLPEDYPNEFTEDVPTVDFSAGDRLQRPEVPELKFPTRDGRVPGAPRKAQITDSTRPAIPSVMDGLDDEAFPSADELVGLANDFDENAFQETTQPRAAPPHEAAAPATLDDYEDPAPEIPEDAPGDLLDLLGAEQEEPGLEHAPDSPGLAPELPSIQRRKKAVSGVLSGTMRLFVEGLADQDVQEPSGQFDVFDESGQSSSLSDSSAILEAPRTIKPTTLGWILIGVIVLFASGYTIYQKTSLFKSDPVEDDDSLLGGDIKQKEEPPKKVKGSISLATVPPGASFFLFLGETPKTIKDFDLGETRIFRMERDGYRGVYRTVKPADFSDGKANVDVTLEPVGAGPAPKVPRLESMGQISGKKGVLTIKSTPPMGLLWHLVGQDKQVEMVDVDTSKSYYFKVMLEGYRPSFVRISEVEFKKNKIYSSSIKLEKLPDVEPKAEPTAEPKTEPKAEPKTEPRAEPKPKATRPRRKKKRRRKKKKRPKVKKPSWAQ